MPYELDKINTKTRHPLKIRALVIGILSFLTLILTPMFGYFFFEFHNVKVDEDTLACSDLIQFLFRGIIRNADSDEKLNVYIPSIRMRQLLYDYLAYKI